MNSNSERVNNNNNGVDNHWDSLSDIPFNTGGGYKTEGGIILTGRAAQQRWEQNSGINARANQASVNRDSAERPIVEQGAEKPPVAVQDPEVVNMPATTVAPDIETADNGAAEAAVEAPSAAPVETEIADTVNEVLTPTSANAETSDTAQKPGEMIAFTQSTEQADALKNNQDYLTYLVSSSNGYAVKKAEAVNTFIDKIMNSDDDKEIDRAIRLGLAITSERNDLSEEDKKRAQDFMHTPEFQKKKIAHDIAVTESRLGGMDEIIQRSENEYKGLRTGGPIARFTKRFKIRDSKGRVATARKNKENALGDIARWREELARLEGGRGKAA